MAARKYSREEVQELLSIWQQSGKSKKQFTEEMGINYMTFIDWYRRYIKFPNPKVKEEKFIPLAIENSGTGIFAEICFKDGKRIVFYQPVSPEYFQKIN